MLAITSNHITKSHDWWWIWNCDITKHCKHEVFHKVFICLTSCPERYIFGPCQSLSEVIFFTTKYLSCSCSFDMNSVPGVIQLLSNRASVGRVSPFSRACRTNISASLADLVQNNELKILKKLQHSICSVKFGVQSQNQNSKSVFCLNHKNVLKCNQTLNTSCSILCYNWQILCAKDYNCLGNFFAYWPMIFRVLNQSSCHL